MKAPKPPRYTQRFVDRFGKARFYLRAPGRKRVALPGLPWSPEFMAAREQALADRWEDGCEIGRRTKPGTVNAALIGYYQSSAFKDGLAKSTQQNRRALLERFREKCGELQVAGMSKAALQKILGNLKPVVARNWKKALRGFADHCLANDLLAVDPLAGVKLVKLKKSGGFPTWTEDEIERYRKRHAPGTKARLALELLLQTGHARSDVVRMGRQHVKSGKLSMRRQKTGVQFDIPMLPALLAELELQPKKDQLAYLTTDQGQPFTPAGFGNWFAARCIEAGVPGRAHGLRKASAVHHALNGATAPELMAWFGWKTISEAQRYIEEANRIRLAENSGAKVISGTAIVKPQTQFDENERNSLKKQEGEK